MKKIKKLIKTFLSLYTNIISRVLFRRVSYWKTYLLIMYPMILIMTLVTRYKTTGEKLYCSASLTTLLQSLQSQRSEFSSPKTASRSIDVHCTRIKCTLGGAKSDETICRCASYTKRSDNISKDIRHKISMHTYRKIQLNTKDMLKDKFFIIIRINRVHDSDISCTQLI